MSRLYMVTLLFNLYAEYIIQNIKLNEAQTRINISERNINNLRHADDTTLMAETEELKIALLHSVFQGQICLLLQVFLDFLLLHSSPL